jgi:thioesterase domain-containing protein
MIDQQVLRISLARLATLGHELKLKEGRVRVSSVAAGAASPVVAIRPPRRTARPPLFLIHPVGGSVIAYYELANHMHPEQPIYAIENQTAFRPGLVLQSTIEEMAESYLREVRAIYQKGPLLLGGYSMGGAVGFEMAWQARKRSEQVSAVLIIDTPARLRDLGDLPEEAISSRELAMIVRMMASRLGREIILPAEELEPLPPDERLERVVAVLKRERVLASQANAPLLRQLLKVVRNNELAQRRYVPKPYDGDLLLFRASDPSPELLAEAPDVYDDPAFGWQAACLKQVWIERLRGEHMRLLNPPYVQALGAALQRHLDLRQPEGMIAPF